MVKAEDSSSIYVWVLKVVSMRQGLDEDSMELDLVFLQTPPSLPFFSFILIYRVEGTINTLKIWHSAAAQKHTAFKPRFTSSFLLKSCPTPTPTPKQSQTMVPQLALYLILNGCKLARDLEARLVDLGNQPETLSKSCDDIINIFTAAKQGLNNAHPQDPYLFTHGQPSQQEWLRYGVITPAMDMVQSRTSNTSIGGEIQAMDASGSGNASSSSSQRSHRRLENFPCMYVCMYVYNTIDFVVNHLQCSSRKGGEEKFTIRGPAPQMGNTDVPPEDNYTWRKYGQKEILGSRYPRAYYRCTHQKTYNCPAKKQVQRLDNDFNTFEVTYIGQHTCHMSSTAPSIAPPPPLVQDQMIMAQAMVSQPTLPPSSSSSVAPLGTWLSMEFSLGSGSGSSSGGRRGGDAGASSSSTAAAGGRATTGSRYGRDVVEYLAVADMADAMFNSGSSSNNSMDFIFPHVDDKWEAGGGAGDKDN
ncbi:hypothetical protein GQ457_05G023370 [Hibiscus cannabinus]